MPALSYIVDTKLVGKDPYSDEPISAPHIVWGADHVTVTATEAMEAEAGKPNESSSSALEIAKDFLSRTLATGPASKADMDEEAEANGIKERT